MENDCSCGLCKSHGVRIAGIVVLAILALFLLAQTMNPTLGNLNLRPANPATDTITVQGDGQATLPPDVPQMFLSPFRTQQYGCRGCTGRNYQTGECRTGFRKRAGRCRQRCEDARLRHNAAVFVSESMHWGRHGVSGIRRYAGR